jgi:hypothetical protein
LFTGLAIVVGILSSIGFIEPTGIGVFFGLPTLGMATAFLIQLSNVLSLSPGFDCTRLRKTDNNSNNKNIFYISDYNVNRNYIYTPC